MRLLPAAAIGAAVVALSAYAGSPTMETGLAALMGEDEKTALRVLGHPSSTQDFSGDTVYTWTTSRELVIVIPRVAAAQGHAETAPAGGAAEPHQARCVIKLTANGKGRLTTWEYQGSFGVCRSYVGTLNEYAVASGKI